MHLPLRGEIISSHSGQAVKHPNRSLLNQAELVQTALIIPPVYFGSVIRGSDCRCYQVRKLTKELNMAKSYCCRADI